MSKITQCLFSQKMAKKERASKECRVLQVNLPTRASVDIEFTNIRMTVSEGFTSRKKKTILAGVSGLFRSGQLTAIMGPSGAGKSSLLNALTGFACEGVSGRIRAGDSICELNDQSYSALRAYRKKTSYILQDDRLNPLFTVAELLRFAADMKLGNTLAENVKMTVVKEVIIKLGLVGTENTRCASLSGGQRKRLSIAAELLDNPPVVFLDEPTTGLDSLTSMQCMTMLQSLARDGRTIVCTIHQPSASIYNMIDHVYMVAEGRCIYNGTSENTVSFFAGVGLRCPMYHNPADYILDVATGEYGKFNDILAESCAQTMHRTENKPLPIVNKTVLSCNKISVLVHRPHELYKFSILMRRCVLQQYRDWTVTHLRLVLHLFIGVLLGLLFTHAGSDPSKSVSNLGYLLVSNVYLCYTSLMPAVLKFPLEISVLKKENFNNWYNLKTYYAAVLLTNIPIQILSSFVYSAPSYFLSGQPAEWPRYLMFALALANVSLLAEAFGNVIGTCVNPVNGTFLGAIWTCAMILFMGFIVLFKHMHWFLQAAANLSFLKFGFEAVVLALYSYGRKPMDCESIYCHLRYPSELMKEFSLKPDNYWTDITILVLQLIVFRTLAYFTLRRCMSKSR